ncbi:MAG: ubiquinone biosynthesis protein UbiB, partial [Caulobacteraceae bacterium]|nr:ubiquinone biosynthesis protein UbiB [Caulobacteraceae bacterium]
MDGASAYLRLIGWLWALVRADALLPRELDPRLGPGLRAFARALRLFSGGETRVGRPGERLARALERLGPAAIKLGQFLATRGDIFGVVFAEDLGRLRDRLDPFPTPLARRELRGALDHEIELLFEAFGEPVAAASLAQVHPASLVGGRAVAVKILRPGIERRVARDVQSLRAAARLADRLAPAARRLEPIAFVETIARALRLELDLRFEAAGAHELGEVMARDGFMEAPEVVWAGVGRRVLTLGYAAGLPLSDPAALEQEGIERAAVATSLTRAFLAQALDHGV